MDLGAHFAGRRCTPEHPAAPLNVLALYGGAGQNQRVIRNWNVDALVQASDGHNDSSKLTEAPNDHISIARHPRVEGECWESGREALIDDGIELCSVVAVDLALRARLAAVPGADALVGGPTAIALDTDRGAAHDRRIVFPLVLLVVLAVLGLLLRSLLAPVLLTATVVVSFAASFGLSALIFRYVLGFAGTDQGVPLYAFIFLVALGVDYNIFLMSRAREEACSTATQELQTQLDALAAAHCTRVFSEKISTRIKIRPELEKALTLAHEIKTAAPDQPVILTVHEMKRLPRNAAELMTLSAHLQGGGVQLELLTGPLTGIYDPHGLGSMLFAVLAVLAVATQLDRDYIREKTLEGQQAAAARGNHGGRPKVLDEDDVLFARALRDKGTPMPDIVKKLIIKTGKNAGQHPSVASLYRALADNDA